MTYKNISDYENFLETLNDESKPRDGFNIVVSFALLFTFISIIFSL